MEQGWGGQGWLKCRRSIYLRCCGTDNKMSCAAAAAKLGEGSCNKVLRGKVVVSLCCS